MISMIISVLSVLGNVISLAVKAVFLRLTVVEAKESQEKARELLNAARNGHKMFLIYAPFSIIFTVLLWVIGLLKTWALVSCLVVWFVSFVANVLTIGWLRRKANIYDVKSSNYTVA